ncbi:MAG: glycosyltransferase family 9 protein [Flavobacteriales bacterium]|nr:glycosyltransferase family 9 protein [Flavobacteriales bacterium]
MQKILIIQTAFIGDVILATPLIGNLKAQFPTAKIDFLVKNGNQSLLKNDPNLNEVFVFDKKKKIASILELLKKIRANNYDLVINLHRFASSGILTFLSGAKQKLGFKKNPFSFAYTQSFPHEIGNGKHEVDRNLELIKHFVSNPTRQPKLYPSTADFEAVKIHKLKNYYCLAPASVWFTKQAPKEIWLKLIAKLRAENATIYLLGGPDDWDLCEEIKSKTDTEQLINLAGKLSLMQSAALLKDAKRNFVNDSGPLHLSSAMNAPVSAFFCSTTPLFGFGPLSDDSEIIEVKNLECRPCGLHGHKACPKGNFRCGNELNL